MNVQIAAPSVGILILSGKWWTVGPSHQRTMHRYCRIFRQNPNCLVGWRRDGTALRERGRIVKQVIARSIWAAISYYARASLLRHISLRETNKSFLWVLILGTMDASQRCQRIA